jgi:hypothetical protein
MSNPNRMVERRALATLCNKIKNLDVNSLDLGGRETDEMHQVLAFPVNIGLAVPVAVAFKALATQANQGRPQLVDISLDAVD